MRSFSSPRWAVSFGGNAMANRFQRLILTAACLLLSGTASGQSVADQFNALPVSVRDWVSETCPRSIGPWLWRNCVQQQIDALTRPGWPDLRYLSKADQTWVTDTCPRSIGPWLWRNCAEREISALAQNNSLPPRISAPTCTPANPRARALARSRPCAFAGGNDFAALLSWPFCQSAASHFRARTGCPPSLSSCRTLNIHDMGD